jgi:hypothetical protein
MLDLLNGVFMKTLIVLFVYLSFVSLAYAQSTFEYSYSTSNNEMSIDLAEDGDGNIFIPIINNQYALIIKLDSEGIFIDSLTIYNHEGTCKLEYLVSIDDEHIGALGNWYTDSTAQFWYLLLNKNLEVLEDKKINSDNNHITDFQAIINHRGNIVFIASYFIPNITMDDVCMFEISTEGDMIRSHFFNSPALFNIPCSLLEYPNNSKYKVFSTGRLDTIPTRLTSFINLVDTNFNLIDYEPIHSNDIHPRTSALWLSDTLYVMAGKWLPIGSNDWDMGILKLTSEDSILYSASFGKIDTCDWSGNFKCIDNISQNNVFFIGTNNTGNPYFQESSSWIMVNILDSDFGLKSQQFFGGDAYYNVMSVLATQDSGCVISCTRYDYLNQPDDYDTYILKVNKDGLLVSIPENPITTPEPCIIYPNPGYDAFHVNSSIDNLLLQLFDMTGKLQVEVPIEKGDNQVQVPGLPAGIFLYRISDCKNQLIQAGKWMKQQ